MSVLGRVLLASAERIDIPDISSIDSYVGADFKYLINGLIDSRPFIIKGFEVIDPQNVVKRSDQISISIADAVVFYPGSTVGPFYHGLEEGNTYAQPIAPTLRKNATNYVYMTFSTLNMASDTRAMWDPDYNGGEGGEFTQVINTESAIITSIAVSTSGFPTDTIPICKIEVGSTVIDTITDCRNLLFRLGTGGLNPDIYNQYDFINTPNGFSRTETPIEMTSQTDPNCFKGADKNIQSLKEWMDVVMTKFAEIGGTTYWYETTALINLHNLFMDALATSFKSKGQWQHSDAVPGQLTWTEDIHVKTIADSRDVIIRDGVKTLNDDEVMYVELIREASINVSDVPVIFNGTNIVTSIGAAIGSFTNMVKGDYIKVKSDQNSYYVRVEDFRDSTHVSTTPALATEILLNSVYMGASGNVVAVYTKGIYLNADIQIDDRGATDIENAGGNLFWLAHRSDVQISIGGITTTTLSVTPSEADGTTVKCTATSHGMQDGDRIMFDIASAYYNATPYIVEVETANIFYIRSAIVSTAPTTAYYATVTTISRSSTTGILEESANHCFNTDNKIAISDTLNYDGTYEIRVIDATSFNIPVNESHVPGLSVGLATLARINVRTEIGPSKIIQGEIRYIGEVETENIRNFIGMSSTSQTHPNYQVPSSYDTLNGMANYNCSDSDNITTRVSELTAMMADKSQDKTIKIILDNVDRVINTTNGVNQDITFSSLTSSSASTMNVVIPGSADNSIVLSNILSLPVNSAAYFTIDRNASKSIANIGALSVGLITSIYPNENLFVFAIRLSGTDVWLWNDNIVQADKNRTLNTHQDDIVRQNINARLISGCNWKWNLDGTILTNDVATYVNIPGIANDRNEISAQDITLSSDGSVAYIEINRNLTSAASIRTVYTSTISAINPTLDTFIIARRIGNDILIGEETLIKDNQSIDVGTSDSVLNDLRLKPKALDTVGKGLQIFPAKRSCNGKTLYTFINPLESSKFPRVGYNVGDYNGGTLNNKPLLINMSDPVVGIVTVTVTGPAGSNFTYVDLGHRFIDADEALVGTFTVDITGTNKFTPISVFANEDDTISIVAGSNYIDAATASLDDNIPIQHSKSKLRQFKICTVIHEIDVGVTTTQNIEDSDIIDRRSFCGNGSAGVDEYGVEVEGSDLNDLTYYASFEDNLIDKDMLDYSAGKTTAEFDIDKERCRIEYDADKTITTVGTAVTVSSDPAYTVRVGDVIVWINGSSQSEVRKINTVNSQTSYIISSAFSTANLPALTACNISQCIDIKDAMFYKDEDDEEDLSIIESLCRIDLINKAGSNFDFTNKPSFYIPQTNDQILQINGSTIYETYISGIVDTDTFTVNNATNINNGVAYIVRPMEFFMVNYSDDGLTDSINVACQAITGLDSSSVWDAEYAFVREDHFSDSVNERQMSIIANAGAHLFMRFLANKVSGNGSVNLLSYKSFFLDEEDYTVNGGINNQAYGLLANGSYVNCDVSVSGGKTRISFSGYSGFSHFVPSVNPGNPFGDIEVSINGQEIPRYISSILTSSPYYTEDSGGKYIELDKDYSTYTDEISIKRRIGSSDGSIDNYYKIAAAYPIIVGTSVGCTHANIDAGYTAANTGDRILVIEDQVYSTITKKTWNKDIQIEFAKGITMTLNATSSLADSALSLGNDINVQNMSLIINVSVGQTVDSGIEYNGNKASLNNVELVGNGLGTITNAFILNAGATGNYGNVIAHQYPGNTIVNALVDNSGSTNDVTVIGIA